ncbi:hypothetical protein FCI23_08865 [Actinacidiphila oryziradicis]|uniref:Uncharacterized protein n=1 Tax=Actinacidiphila oryziradicis TaxID=2571141 RepID=A0A4U0SRH4_9ACTN|nr:hypothetical protein FCI23_08865 [Actinacidiphila oryziradicis]
MPSLPRPAEMFDRGSALAAFAGDERGGAALGVISGCRRQGKTFLLRPPALRPSPRATPYAAAHP